jgi:predicted Zn-dependent peptidase
MEITETMDDYRNIKPKQLSELAARYLTPATAVKIRIVPDTQAEPPHDTGRHPHG